MNEEQLYGNLATPGEITSGERAARKKTFGDGFMTLGVEERTARMWADFLYEFSGGRMEMSTGLIGKGVETSLRVHDSTIDLFFGENNFGIRRDCENGVTSVRLHQPVERLMKREDGGSSLIFTFREGTCVAIKDDGRKIKICSAPSMNLIWLDL